METRGSTPQKAGAAMLVYPDGTQAGTLGGGCVEAEVKRRALLGLNDTGRPEVLTFCLDDDYGWDDGLICGGRMTILAQPLAAEGHLLDRAAAITIARSTTRRDAARASPRPSSSAMRSACPSATVISSTRTATPVASLRGAARTGSDRAHCSRRSRHRPSPRRGSGVAYLPALPRITLLLVGGGHVGQAVARLAAEVGFDIWVLDDRDKFASPERFPTASAPARRRHRHHAPRPGPDTDARDLRASSSPAATTTTRKRSTTSRRPRAATSA